MTAGLGEGSAKEEYQIIEDVKSKIWVLASFLNTGSKQEKSTVNFF